MATTDKTPTPEAPDLGEVAQPDDPMNPPTAATVTAPYTAILSPTDSILQAKGGGGTNLRIYSELLRDDQVQAAWGQRRLALTSCDTVVEPGADDPLSVQAAEALQEEINALPWDDITDKALYALYYGWGVAEVMWRPDGARVRFDRIVVRERARFRFDRQGRLYLWRLGWEPMPDRKFWVVRHGGDNHDELYGLGLAHSLYWPVFFKRNDIKFWLTFLEKFGQPTAVARLPAGQSSDPVTVGKAKAMLRQIATDAGVVIPDTVTIELLEAARSGAADYGALHDAMNRAISKIIVGQTMTTDDGASLSQAKVHFAIRQEIVEADADLLADSFNQGPVRWWTEWNFPCAVPPRVYRHTEPAEDLAARAERDTKIAGLGYEPTEDYVLKTYGEGWVKKATAPNPLQLIAGMQQPGDQQPQQDGAQFAEAAALSLLRAARRQDQDALLQAAQQFAEQYQTVTGQRVRQVLQAAEAAGDPDLFLRRLDEMLAEAPPRATVDKLTRAGMASRLLGALRGQRRPS